jgi:hypothetical protein
MLAGNNLPEITPGSRKYPFIRRRMHMPEITPRKKHS